MVGKFSRNKILICFMRSPYKLLTDSEILSSGMDSSHLSSFPVRVLTMQLNTENANNNNNNNNNNNKSNNHSGMIITIIAHQ